MTFFGQILAKTSFQHSFWYVEVPKYDFWQFWNIGQLKKLILAKIWPKIIEKFSFKSYPDQLKMHIFEHFSWISHNLLSATCILAKMLSTKLKTFFPAKTRCKISILAILGHKKLDIGQDLAKFIFTKVLKICQKSKILFKIVEGVSPQNRVLAKGQNNV